MVMIMIIMIYSYITITLLLYNDDRYLAGRAGLHGNDLPRHVQHPAASTPPPPPTAPPPGPPPPCPSPPGAHRRAAGRRCVGGGGALHWQRPLAEAVQERGPRGSTGSGGPQRIKHFAPPRSICPRRGGPRRGALVAELEGERQLGEAGKESGLAGRVGAEGAEEGSEQDAGVGGGVVAELLARVPVVHQVEQAGARAGRHCRIVLVGGDGAEELADLARRGVVM